MLSLRFLPTQQLASDFKDRELEQIVGGCAALLHRIASPSADESSDSLADWLAKGPAVSNGLLRAVTATVSPEARLKALEKAWQTFGDKLYIKHTPVSQQEALLRVLILLASATHQEDPSQVFLLSRSSLHTEGMSNRLGAPAEQARVLGMLYGTLISEMVDKAEARMKFEFDDDEKRRLEEYKILRNSSFKVGSIADLRSPPRTPSKSTQTLTSRPKSKAVQPDKPKNAAPSISIIEEINDGDDDDDEDADLAVYAKPDSDREDSDPEDVSVSRSAKPKAPVYIRELLAMLESTDDADAHSLALNTAPGLIKRKATFGSELKDQALGLAAAYANLQDTLGLDDWQDLRVQGLTALIAACPHETGPWVAAQVFAGDYSTSTRNTLLLCIGLAGHALSGAASPAPDDPRFPSKTLPERLHKMYAADTPQSALARRLDKTSAMPAKATSRLGALIPPTLFFPLLAGAHAHLPTRSATLGKSTLPLFLQTLGLLLAHAGPAAPQRAAMATELWDLTLALRARATAGPALEAVLFALLGALGALGDRRRVALEKGRELLETHGWVEAVLGQLEAQGVVGEEERRVQSLAAGVGVACKEIVDQYHRLLVGEMVDYG